MFAAICGAPLSWDGSYVLFRMLDSGAPVLHYNRLTSAPLHGIVLLIARVTSDVAVLRVVFGLVYAAIPLAALGLSWWVLKDGARSLFIWPAMGIALGTLPGQFYFISDAMIAMQLSWPVMLAALTTDRWRHSLVVALLAVAVFFTHPTSAILLAVAAMLALGAGLFRKDERRSLWLLGLGLCALSAIRVAMFVIWKSPWEVSELSFQLKMEQFRGSVLGLPILSLACVWLAACMAFISPMIGTPSRRKLTALLSFIEVASLTTAGGLLLIWAKDPHLWWRAYNFRAWALFASLPFILMAALEGLAKGRAEASSPTIDWPHRLRSIQFAGVIFLLVISVQSTVWANLSARLRGTVLHGLEVCRPTSSIGWQVTTPLDTWATPVYAIILQGRTAKKLVLDGDACGASDFPENVRIAPWYVRSNKEGWFDIRPIQPFCSFTLESGWYQKEVKGSDWFRWADQRAEVHVFAKKAGSAVLSGSLCSAEIPNKVDVLVGDHTQGTLQIAGGNCQAIASLPIRVKPGYNTIRFLSRNPARVRDMYHRPLAIGMGNLRLTVDNATCELSP